MKLTTIAGVAGAALLLAGCATVEQAPVAGANPDYEAQLQAAAPKPIEGNAGKFMSPFTSDGVTTEWVTKAMSVKAGGQIGSAAGALVGQQALKSVPFLGSFLGDAVGNEIGRSAAMSAIGGEEFLKNSSDLSFNSLVEMAAYLRAFHATHPEFKSIVEATNSIYPDFKQTYLAKYGRI